MIQAQVVCLYELTVSFVNRWMLVETIRLTEMFFRSFTTSPKLPDSSLTLSAKRGSTVTLNSGRKVIPSSGSQNCKP